MNKNHDILEQATKALSQGAVPQGPSDDLIRQTLDKIEKTEHRTNPLLERIFKMKTPLKLTAAAVFFCVFGLLIFFGNGKTIYAQVIEAMKKAQSIHVTGYRLHEGEMVKDNEMWYRRNIGYKMVDQHKGAINIMIDDGQSFWKYKQGHDFAIKSRSVTTENMPKEITETHKYLEKCNKDKIDILDGIPCQLYTGSYPSKPDTTRLMCWVDGNLWPRRFEEKVLEGNTWKTIELVEIEYDVDIDATTFKPDFGPHVEIVDEGKVLDEYFSLEKAIFTKEEMGLVFAVHEVQKCENDLIFTVTSLRPTQKTYNEVGQRAALVWDYGDYQFGSCFERLDEKDRYASYAPIELAWFYQNGLLVRWTVFIPRGFEPGQVDEIKLELYYLYANGSWAAKRRANGLEDRMRIKPIAILPLPDNVLSIESQLNKTYNLIKLLEPMNAEKHLDLKPIPFTDEEMEEAIKEMPNDGITKMWKAGDKSSRLYHGQSQKPSQISFKIWLEDRLTHIEKYQNQ